MTSSYLQSNEYAPYYKPYIEALDEVELKSGFQDGIEFSAAFFKTIPLDKHEFRYAEGKWTIKDILQHVIDTERILAYRALRIARNDTTPLPGFEENNYVETAHANRRSINDLLEEFAIVRKATVSLFSTFTDLQLISMGTASDNPFSVRAIGFIILGHQKHHERIIRERYL